MQRRNTVTRLLTPASGGVFALAAMLAGGTSHAETIYWDGATSGWDTLANWSTASGATTPNPAAVPGSGDSVIFNITTANAGQTVSLNADQAAQSITINLTGGMTLNGNTTATGTSARTLSIGSGGLTISSTAGAVTLGSSTTNQNILLTGSGALTKSNTGNLLMRGNNGGFSGDVYVQAGTMQAGTNGNAWGTGTVTIGDAVLGANARIEASTLTVANNIVVAAGAGTRTLANWGGQSPTYSGNITLNNNLSIESNTFLRFIGGMSGTGNLTVLSTGTTNGLQFGDHGLTGQPATMKGGLIDFNGTITVASGSVSTSPVIFQGTTAIGASVTQLIHNGPNYLTLRSPNAAFVGDVSVNTSGGIFRIEHAQAVGTSTTLSLASGTTFELFNVDGAIEGLSGAGSVFLTAGSTPRTLTVGGASGSFVHSGNLTAGTPANLALTKSGNSLQTLSGSYNYGGITNVNGGVLRVNGVHSGAGAYAVNSGGTLAGGTSGAETQITMAANGNITVAAGGKLAPGAAAGGISTLRLNLGTGTLNLAGAVTDTSTAALLFDLGATADKVELAAGTLAIGSGVLEFDDFGFTPAAGLAAGTYTLVDTTAAINGTLGSNLTGSIGGFDAALSLGDSGQDLVLTVSSVPEPASLGLLALGAAGLLRRRRTR
jgi:fibronectin-binding autotransporter adhesin